MVGRPARREVRGRPARRDGAGAARPGPSGEGAARAQRGELQDQRRAVFRRVVRARRRSSGGSPARGRERRVAAAAPGAPQWKPIQSRRRPRRRRARAAFPRRPGSAAPPRWRGAAAAAASGRPRRHDACRAAPWRPARRGSRPARRPPGRRSREVERHDAHRRHGEELHPGRGGLAATRSRRRACAAPAARRPAPAAPAAPGPAARRPAPRPARPARRSRPGDVGVPNCAAGAARCSARPCISPRLNAAPPPPVRPRSITSPASGPRSRV